MIKQLTSKTIKNALFLVAFLIAATPALAEDAANEHGQATADIKKEKRSVDGIELQDLATQAEHWFKMPILIAPNAGHSVYMNLSKKPLSYGEFLTQLNISGLTAYKSNGYIQIIPNRDARNLDVPFVEKHKTYLEDEYVTDVLKTEKACAARVLAVTRPLVPQYGHLSVLEEANSLIIVDTYGNIQRVKSVIKALEANMDEKEECGKNKKGDSQPDKK